MCPNKKVTKEVVRGEALRANTGIAERLPPASDLFRFAARSTTSPGSHFRRVDHRPLKMFRFSVGSAVLTCKDSSMKAFKNRYIFECWMAMRLGIPKGAHLLEAPLRSVSFGTFLAETRKVRSACQKNKSQLEKNTPRLLGAQRKFIYQKRFDSRYIVSRSMASAVFCLVIRRGPWSMYLM